MVGEVVVGMRMRSWRRMRVAVGMAGKEPRRKRRW